MKKICRKSRVRVPGILLAAALLICLGCAGGARADIRTSGDWQYEEYTYQGETSSCQAARIKKYLGEAAVVTIPGTLDGLPVCELGSSIFKYTYEYADGAAVYSGTVESVTIPSGVKTIDEAFYGQSRLRSITLPAGVEEVEIGDGCGVTRLEIPDSVKKYYIKTLPDLTFVRIPKSGSDTSGRIEKCPELTEIKIPDGTTRSPAISECEKLSSVSMPDSVTDMDLITNCRILSSVKLSKSIRDVRITKCPSLTGIVLPEGDERIATFEGCSALAEITIPVSVTWVGYHAFAGCDALRKVTYRGNKYQWKNITISDGNENLTGASRTCAATPKLNLKIRGSSLDHFADDYKDCIFQITKRDREVTLIKAAKTGTSIGLPKTVTYKAVPYKLAAIADGAFKKNAKLTIVDLGSCDYLKKIGKNAFASCKKLERISFNPAVVSIGDGAFSNCTKLNTADYYGVRELQKMQTIGAKAFYNCRSLRWVYIHSKVKKIGKSAFRNCKNLSRMYIYSTKLTSKNVGAKAFAGTTANMKIYLPKKKHKAYAKLLRKRGIPAGVTIYDNND